MDQSLVIDVAQELPRTEPPLTTPHSCIYRVPPHIRKVNDEAYTPEVISIGPFHFGNERLQFMERHKLRYLKSFLDRAQYRKSFKEWVVYVTNLNPSVRSYYANLIELNDHDLAKVILVDASFILELFLRNFNDEWTDEIFNGAFPNRQDNIGVLLPSLLQLSFEYFAYYKNQRLMQYGCKL
ncbi:hypothetical protein O6P43_014661 [Quillaja saponaria]|uniref:Uncharacterized protein n=1 Tax=Quillaja saponaria TaxID=32244 RepID=A0AAD7PRK8_QUISA|nr:hypothetical protein O6P43_014661 [Quillaja saponaria]